MTSTRPRDSAVERIRERVEEKALAKARAQETKEAVKVRRAAARKLRGARRSIR